MKRLFDENDKWTLDANQLDREGRSALKEIFASYVAKGFSRRDISHILHLTIMDFELESILRNDQARRGGNKS